MHRKYYENADECCYYIRERSYQDMANGVWVSHFRAEHKIVAYHNFSKDNMRPDVMYNAQYDKVEPQNGDICSKCNRKIMIIEDNN